MTYDDLRAAELDALFHPENGRYGKYLAGLPMDSAHCDDLFGRIYDAFDTASDLLLLFEDECRDRADVIGEVLAGRTASERRFLKMNPADLGVRCEAYLSGIPAEQLSNTPRFGERDRSRLGDLTLDALVGMLPAV